MSEDEEESPVMENIIFLVLLVGAIILVFSLIWSQMNGADFWGDYYAKEIVKIVNSAQPGDKFEIDFQKATVVAKKNGVLNQLEIFNVDNLNKEICIKLSPGIKTCYSYFNDVDVLNYKIDSGAFTESEKNILTFDIEESRHLEAEGGK